MTAEPGSEILQAAVSKGEPGFAQPKQAWVDCVTLSSACAQTIIWRLKSDLGYPRDRRFRLANTGATTQPDHALGAGPLIKLARIAQTVRCTAKPRYRGPQPFR